MGYTISVMNQPADHIQSFINASTTRDGPLTAVELSALFGFAVGLYLPGGIIGSLAAGFASEHLGRKRTLIIGHVLAVIGSLLTFTATYSLTPEMIYIGRLLVGIKCGTANCIVPMFLAEIVPCNLRGTLTTCHQLFITVGVFVASVLGLPQLFGSAQLWPCLFFVQLIPAVVAISVLPFFPESPRYLLFTRHNEEQALAALAFYRCSTPDPVSEELASMYNEHNEHQVLVTESAMTPGMTSTMTYLDLFRKRHLRRALVISCTLQIIQQLSGINSIFFSRR